MFHVVRGVAGRGRLRSAAHTVATARAPIERRSRAASANTSVAAAHITMTGSGRSVVPYGRYQTRCATSSAHGTARSDAARPSIVASRMRSRNHVISPHAVGTSRIHHSDQPPSSPQNCSKYWPSTNGFSVTLNM